MRVIFRYALIANGMYNPFLGNVPLPEHMRYPIASNYNGKKDLEYSSLLLGDGFIIDSNIYDLLRDSRKDYMKPMVNSLAILEKEGLLELADYSIWFSMYKERIAVITDAYLSDPIPWLMLAQKQWKSLKPELQEFQKYYGSDSMCKINTGNMGIETWLSNSDQFDNEDLREQLYGLFEERIDIGKISIENVKGSLQFIIAQIIMSNIVSSEAKCPILDWSDSGEMYKKSYTYRLKDQSDEIELLTRNEGTTRLLNYIVPNLKPCSINEVIHFIRYNGAVKSLRETLIEMIEHGVEIDDTWFARYQSQLLLKDIADQRFRSKIGIVGTIAGMLPIPWPLSAAVTAITQTAQKFRKGDDKYNWYYALQENILNR